MTLGRTLLLVLASGLLAAQLVPYPPAENPPIGQEVPATAEVRTILETSCYDCHSNETVWPWYSQVIPAKWFVRGHVVEGRQALNFSTWERYSPERAARKLEEVVEMVEEERMPQPSYLRMHPEAVLSPEEAAEIIEWASAQGEANGGEEGEERPGTPSS
jgi:hypothetical protein